MDGKKDIYEFIVEHLANTDAIYTINDLNIFLKNNPCYLLKSKDEKFFMSQLGKKIFDSQKYYILLFVKQKDAQEYLDRKNNEDFSINKINKISSRSKYSYIVVNNYVKVYENLGD